MGQEGSGFSPPAGPMSAELAALSRELARDSASDDGAHYYHHWVAALERLAAERKLAGPAELAERKAAWAKAYARTPHGRSVELSD